MLLSSILRRALAALLLLAALPSQATLDPACEAHFYEKAPPVVQSPVLREKAKGLCYESFALAHSGLFRTPLWVAERLTRESLRAARAVDRDDAFHPDPRLGAAERAELGDYARSGYDRGHLAPAADMPTVSAQRESFSLANMVPQHPDSNQRVWASIESAVRGLATRHGEVYVVSGPVYSSPQARLVGRVAVPDSLYKAVYLPGQGAAVYVVDNAPQSSVRTYTVAQVESALHIDLFPGLPDEVKQRKLLLPALTIRKPVFRKKGAES